MYCWSRGLLPPVWAYAKEDTQVTQDRDTIPAPLSPDSKALERPQQGDVRLSGRQQARIFVTGSNSDSSQEGHCFADIRAGMLIIVPPTPRNKIVTSTGMSTGTGSGTGTGTGTGTGSGTRTDTGTDTGTSTRTGTGTGTGTGKPDKVISRKQGK
ncbi:hypothetical protein PoB_002257900 [Plakobranchus ocellatus]|uniref:SHSP domain-containing protein n=1 Tax=Plakobranchus ocellatus TaxID=259542 RepID=A0AAV3ZL97_9GAST|nr:hypothetical protein PoB_002257900 [Plakobranchus ocellatus]